MWKKALLGAGVALLIGGCGGWDDFGLANKGSPQAKRYAVIRALDRGDYEFVVNALKDDPTYGGAFSEEEGRLNLAAGYIGRAGFDINKIIESITSTGTTGDAFNAFAQKMAKGVTARDLIDMTEASKNYRGVQNSCSPLPAERLKKDACFYRTLIDLVRATLGLNFLVGDITNWFGVSGCDLDANENTIRDYAEASACAITFALGGSCLAGVVPSNLGQVTFKRNGKNYSFDLVRISVNPSGSCTKANTFYRLIDRQANPNTQAVTIGYCRIDFTPCQSPDPDNGCYPCPVVDEDGKALTVTGTIADSMNGLIDSIAGVAGQNSGLTNTIESFVENFCGTDKECQPQDISDYINNIRK